MNYTLKNLLHKLIENTNEIASGEWNTGISRIATFNLDFDNATAVIKCEYGGTVNTESEWSEFWIDIMEDSLIQFESSETKLTESEIVELETELSL
jgi:hypothetical protein